MSRQMGVHLGKELSELRVVINETYTEVVQHDLLYHSGGICFQTVMIGQFLLQRLYHNKRDVG